MKPTSIIFIIISVVLIIAGLVTMSFAGESDPNILSTEAGNVMMYPADGGSYRDIYRVNIDVKNASVIINGINMGNVGDFLADSSIDTGSSIVSDKAGDSETSQVPEATHGSNVKAESSVKVRLTNFAEGLYECQYSNRVLSIKDNYDTGSVSGILSLVKNFKGLRHYLNYPATTDLDKTIEIDVTGDVSINCVVGDGSVTIIGISSSEDCSVKIGKGDVTVKDSHVVLDEFTGFPKRGAFVASVENGDISIENGEFDKYTVKFGEAAYHAINNSESASQSDTLPVYHSKEHKELGGGYDIGEYYITTAFGTLTLKEKIPYICTLDIEYSDEERGVYSATPNSAGTRYTVTEKHGSFITATFEARED